jgi:hypothetical protein
MPYVLSGRVTGEDGRRPPELLVAVNGRLAGVAGGYEQAGDGWDFTAYVADFYRDGANEVALYEAERSGRRAILHPVGG